MVLVYIFGGFLLGLVVVVSVYFVDIGFGIDIGGFICVLFSY